VRARLGVYRQATEPLTRFYAARSVLARIDGEKGIDQVEASVRAVVLDGGA